MNSISMIKNINRYREITLYCLCGGCVTILNIGAYYFWSYIVNLTVLMSTILAWLIAVIFAYIVNRKYVFKSRVDNINGIVREFFFFVGCRGWSEMIDVLAMLIFVSYLSFPDMIIKGAANILVIIFNYLMSKFYIFRNIDKNEDDRQGE